MNYSNATAAAAASAIVNHLSSHTQAQYVPLIKGIDGISREWLMAGKKQC